MRIIITDISAITHMFKQIHLESVWDLLLISLLGIIDLTITSTITNASNK